MRKSSNSPIFNTFHSKGAILLEFALSIPVFLMFAAAIIELGSIMWETQFMNDAIRHGARRASMEAQNYEPVYWASESCDLLADVAYTEANNYLSTIGFKTGRWQIVAEDVQIKKIQSTVGSVGTPDIIDTYLLSIKATVSSQKNCIFCFANYFSGLYPKVYSSFALSLPACITGLGTQSLFVDLSE